MNWSIKIDRQKMEDVAKIIKQKLYRFVNTGPIAKALCFILIWVVATLPFDVYWLLRWLFNPETFWENLALFVGWCILLGWVQAVFFIFGVVVTLQLLLDDKW